VLKEREQLGVAPRHFGLQRRDAEAEQVRPQLVDQRGGDVEAAVVGVDAEDVEDGRSRTPNSP
jgi:hypothetical protein